MGQRILIRDVGRNMDIAEGERLNYLTDSNRIALKMDDGSIQVIETDYRNYSVREV